jgi:hypothetical protein
MVFPEGEYERLYFSEDLDSETITFCHHRAALYDVNG